MLEYNNPSLDVDDLMLRVQQEVERRGAGLEPGILGPDGSPERAFANVYALIDEANAKAEVRTRWSPRLNLFPFNRSTRLQRFALKALALLFNDQRQVNFALIGALRETLALSRELAARVQRLEAVGPPQHELPPYEPSPNWATEAGTTQDGAAHVEVQEILQ